MEGYLSQNQIKYIFDHLEQAVCIPEGIKDQFVYTQNRKVDTEAAVVFILSVKKINLTETFNIDDLPVLFPNSSIPSFYTVHNHQLVFNHDILKACFYLLSGYQEYNSKNTDHFGRYPFKHSIQFKLGFIGKPLVNYFFEIIIQALIDFFGAEKIKRKKNFRNFGFLLSHDIDNIDYYTFKRFLYKLKEFGGFATTTLSKKQILADLFQTGVELLKFGKKKNPIWNFDYLMHLEQKNGLKSAFYFLTKGIKNADSDYTFSEQRLQTVFHSIKANKCEIGIHGTVASARDQSIMNRIISDLKAQAEITKLGGRQHRLIYNLPETALIHEKAGLLYDSSLCFAEHEGFRNSYCLPFKLYDFESDRPIECWQIPLNVMDVTMFHYRKLNLQEAHKAICLIIEEIKKFNGVFTLLWHNDFFEDNKYPGISHFYDSLLHEISNKMPESLTGLEIAQRCSTN